MRTEDIANEEKENRLEFFEQRKLDHGIQKIYITRELLPLTETFAEFRLANKFIKW